MISFVALKHKVKSSFSSNQELFCCILHFREMAASEMIQRRGRRVGLYTNSDGNPQSFLSAA